MVELEVSPADLAWLRELVDRQEITAEQMVWSGELTRAAVKSGYERLKKDARKRLRFILLWTVAMIGGVWGLVWITLPNSPVMAFLTGLSSAAIGGLIIWDAADS